MNRIQIIGPAGSGKTALGAHLSVLLGLPHVELDSLHWRENWQQTPLDEFRQAVVEALSGDAWVVDGNYSKVRDIIWQQVQVVVWLDLPLLVVLYRLLARSLRRAISGEVLWAGNRESFRQLFFSRDSLLLYTLQTFRRRRRTYTELSAAPENERIRFVRLSSSAAVRRWVEQVTPTD
jgi:adenylate kinase family enzyme